MDQCVIMGKFPIVRDVGGGDTMNPSFESLDKFKIKNLALTVTSCSTASSGD